MPVEQLLFRLLKCIFGALIIKAWMAQIGAVNIANGSGIIHCQCCGKEWDGGGGGGGRGWRGLSLIILLTQWQGA